MKMHVVTAAALVALASQAVLAASEGGDTWSEVERVQQSANSTLKFASGVDAAPEPAKGAAFEASEGGDTWSSVQTLSATPVEASSHDRAGQSNSEAAADRGGRPE